MSQEGHGQTEQNIDKKFEEIINGMPDEVKEEIVEGITSIQRTQSMSFPPEALVMTKINEEHISDFLAASRENMQKSYQEKFHNKIFQSFLIVMAVIFVIAIIVLLKSQPEIMEKIIYMIFGFLGGVAGGYGVGRRKRNEDNDD